MRNGWDIAIEFNCERKKIWPLYIWSHRTQYKGSSALNVISTSLSLNCCDCLDWSKKKYRKDPSQPHQAFESQVCHAGQKLLFSNSSCVQIYCRIHFTLVNHARSIWKECPPFPHLIALHQSACSLFPHPFAFSQSRSLVVLGSK
jgi:hypothetical protein